MALHLKRRLSKVRSFIGFCWGSIAQRRVASVDVNYVQLCFAKEPGSLRHKLGYHGWSLRDLGAYQRPNPDTATSQSLAPFFEVPDEILTYWVSLEHNIDRYELSQSRERYQREVEIWKERADRAIASTASALRRLKPCAVLYLQGYLPAPYALRAAAAALGIPCLALEKTFNDRLMIWSTVSGISVNRHEFKLLFDKLKQTLDPALVDAWMSAHRHDHKKLKFKDHKTPETSIRIAKRDEGKPNILFLGQVHNDSSCHFGLHPAHLSQAHIIARLHRFCEANGYNLLVKFHPKEATGGDPLNAKPIDKATYRKSITLLDRGDAPDYWDADNRFSTESFIELADLAITINSQSSFDALLASKPVILCGEAYFDNLGFTRSAPTPESLETLIKGLLPLPMSDAESRSFNRFFYFLNTRYLKTGTAKSLSDLLRRASLLP